jgi:hypothetical protein
LGSNWVDSNGLACSSLNEPTIMGSGKKDACLWWQIDDSILVYDEQGPLCILRRTMDLKEGLAT